MAWFHEGRGADGWASDGYTERFKEEVRSIRKRFKTQKTRTGLDEQGSWIPCDLSNRNVSVMLTSYEWGCIDDGAVVFKVKFLIGQEKQRNPFWVKIFNLSEKTMQVFYRGAFHMVFPRHYPFSPPKIKHQNIKVRVLDPSSSHHVLRDGELCLFEGYNDWNSDKDNACSALLVGLEWCVMHYVKYGW